jgi:VWFA-related protein
VIAVLLSQFWMQRLGWTLLHFLWQGTAIAAVYAILRSLLRRSLLSQGRYVLACGAFLAMAATPPATFLLISNVQGPASWMITTEWQRLLPAVVVLWVLGVLAFSIRLLGGWRFAARLRSTAHPAPAEWWQTLDRISVRLGVKRRVRLLVSSLVDVPTVIGWLRPAILVPVEFLIGGALVHVTALLAHELAHIRRSDYLASLLQGVVESVLFYHPAVWWLSEQIRAERELCCDDLAVAATGDVLAYARALADLEARRPVHLTPALAANGGSLVNRVRRLIEPAHAMVESAPGPGAAWAMTLLWLAGIALASIHGSTVTSSKRASREPVGHVLALVPSPGPASADRAGSVLLYDPLLAAHPVAHRGESTEVPAAHVNREPDPPASALFAPAPDLSDATQHGESTSLRPPLNFSGNRLPAPAPPADLRSAVPPILPEGLPVAPTFRAATQMVQVDVIARRKGAPATGLTEGDFTLLDDRQPQRIASFTVTSPQTQGPAFHALPVGVISNRIDQGDSLANPIVLLIDQRNTAQADQAYALQRLAKFVRAHKKEQRVERIGLYALDRDGLHIVQEITGDPELLRRAAENLKAQTPRYRSDIAEERVLIDTKRAVEEIARHLAGVPGHKGLIWVSSSSPIDLRSSGLNSDLEQAARALGDVNAALYSVDARGLVGSLSGATPIPNAESSGFEPVSPWPLFLSPAWQASEGSGSRVSAMSVLADLTGGVALYNSNGIEDSIQQALNDAELTYTLGFYPAPEAQAGVWHKLKVEVAQPGVTVRYRAKYFAPSSLTKASARPTLPELLNTPLNATQMQLMAETEPDLARPDFRRVRAAVDLRGIHLENENNIWAGAVDVSFFLEGSSTVRTVTRKLEIPDRQLASALQQGIVIDDSIGVSGQRGELRIVAQDRATGAAGSVRIPLDHR